MALLNLKDIHHTYKMGQLKVEVLKGIDIQIQKGEFEITDDEPKIDFDDYADLLGRTALDSPGFTRLKETNK